MGRWPYPITEIMERIAYATLKAAKAKQEAEERAASAPENHVEQSDDEPRRTA